MGWTHYVYICIFGVADAYLVCLVPVWFRFGSGRCIPLCWRSKWPSVFLYTAPFLGRPCVAFSVGSAVSWICALYLHCVTLCANSVAKLCYFLFLDARIVNYIRAYQSLMLYYQINSVSESIPVVAQASFNLQ